MNVTPKGQPQLRLDGGMKKKAHTLPSLLHLANVAFIPSAIVNAHQRNAQLKQKLKSSGGVCCLQIEIMTLATHVGVIWTFGRAGVVNISN